MNKATIIFISIIALISLAVGFFGGRSSVKIPEPERIVEVRWEKGEEKRDTLKIPVPYIVFVSDSVPPPIPTDTAALFATWRDYYKERRYDLDFSDDSLGTFKVDAIVSQNKLISATSVIQPNIRTVYEKEVIYKVPTFQPWAVIGTSADFGTNKIQLGLDIKNKYILGVSGIRFNDKYSYTLDFGIKF